MLCFTFRLNLLLLKVFFLLITIYNEFYSGLLQNEYRLTECLCCCILSQEYVEEFISERGGVLLSHEIDKPTKEVKA